MAYHRLTRYAAPRPMFRPCLLIPVYNHGSLIEATWARLRSLQLPCLLVDDGSEPGTASVLDQLADDEPLLTLLRLPRNRGKGVACLHGIAEAYRLGYTHAVQVDADGQHDVTDIPAMLAMAEREPEALVSGAPQYGDDIPASRLYGRYITHFWVWIETLSFDITDSMCGFRVYPVAATHTLAQQVQIGERMTFDTDIMVRLYWQGVPVRFLPTRVVYPENGISHFRPLRDNLHISWMHTKLVCGMLWRVCRGDLPVAHRHMPYSSGLPAGRPYNNNHWSQQQERGAAWGLRFSLWCYRHLGPRAMHFLLYFIIGWFFLFGSSARQASQQYLARVLPHAPSLLDGFRHFLSFGKAIVDKLGAWSGNIRRDDVVFTERSVLLQQAASGKGGVILTSHLGNIDMCRALVHSVPGIRLNVLLFMQNARQIAALLNEVNDASMAAIDIGQIDPAIAMKLHERIQRGEFIVIAADRTSPTAQHRITFANFLGSQAPFPQGPFILASLLECPVFLMFALHNGSQYEIIVERFADTLDLPRRQREALLATTVQRYADRLEHYCRQAPLQWFNFFNFWQAQDSRQDHD